MNDNKQGMGRRSFLKLAGMATVAGTGAMVAGCSPRGDDKQVGSVPGGSVTIDQETDVLIIGAGMSGLWTAYALAKGGVKAIAVEKLPSWGGDAILAEGILPIQGTIVQEQHGVPHPTPEEAWAQAQPRFEEAKYQEVQRSVFINAPRVVEIWTEEFGIEWIDMKNTPRWTPFFHVHKDGLHNVDKLLRPLYDYARNNDVEFMFESRAVSLITNEDDAVVGARIRDEVSGRYTDIGAKRVVLATGDYVSNQELVARYAGPFAKTAIYTPNSMGDGHLMGSAVGAELVNMGRVVAMGPDYVPTTTHGLVESILNVYPNGQRIGSEYSFAAPARMAYQENWTIFWTIYDESVHDGPFKNTFEARERMGGVVVAETLEELAAETLIPYENLRATIERFNADAEADGVDTEFNKPIGITPINPPYYAVKSFPVRYKAAGGLAINDECQVLNRAENPIPNLYAVGGAQGEVGINIHQASALGLYVGELLVTDLT